MFIFIFSYSQEPVAKSLQYALPTSTTTTTTKSQTISDPISVDNNNNNNNLAPDVDVLKSEHADESESTRALFVALYDAQKKLIKQHNIATERLHNAVNVFGDKQAVIELDQATTDLLMTRAQFQFELDELQKSLNTLCDSVDDCVNNSYNVLGRHIKMFLPPPPPTAIATTTTTTAPTATAATTTTSNVAVGNNQKKQN